ncbi:MAG: thiosulfate oxidation carrier complex protein SoxZ [Rhodospirillaceae bacterium]
MAKDIQPRVRIPSKLKPGEIFEVKTLVTHPMESGQRTDKDSGKKIPKDIIHKLRCVYNGKEVLVADWHPAVSANPFTSFHLKADKSGELVLTWTDTAGTDYTKAVKVNVG